MTFCLIFRGVGRWVLLPLNRARIVVCPCLASICGFLQHPHTNRRFKSRPRGFWYIPSLSTVPVSLYCFQMKLKLKKIYTVYIFSNIIPYKISINLFNVLLGLWIFYCKTFAHQRSPCSVQTNPVLLSLSHLHTNFYILQILFLAYSPISIGSSPFPPSLSLIVGYLLLPDEWLSSWKPQHVFPCCLCCWLGLIVCVCVYVSINDYDETCSVYLCFTCWESYCVSVLYYLCLKMVLNNKQELEQLDVSVIEGGCF